MPQSKEHKAEYNKRYYLGILERKLGILKPHVIPNNVKPNRYLLAHLKVCPDYDVNSPGNHYDHCPYVNPMLRPPEPLPNCPDGRYHAQLYLKGVNHVR